MKFWVAVDNYGLGEKVYREDPGRIRWHTVWIVEAESEAEAVASARRSRRRERERPRRSR